MTWSELQSQIRRSAKARLKLADRDTPLIKNCWYVAARSTEVTRTPMERMILGTSVLLLRSLNNEAIALQNRCCHRSFPLSEGKLENDVITCGYHGLQYALDGRCIKIPSQDRVPSKISLRSFPVVEQGSFVWIWMGIPELADVNLLPCPEWLGHPDWALDSGYLNVSGSYVYLHENLLDLSHLSFLHETTFGTPEYAKAPYVVNITEDDIQVWRHVECFLPAIYAEPLGWQGMRALRKSGSQFVSPGLHVNTGILQNLELAPNPQSLVPTIKVAQIITPESQDRVHYYYALARNFSIDRQDIGVFMMKAISATFHEDIFALQKITEMHNYPDQSDFFEIDIPTDRAGVEMRRRLKIMADKDQSLYQPNAETVKAV